MTLERSVYVISDLHIGGAYPDPTAAHPQRQRGFRMMTRVAELTAFINHLTRLPATPAVELVINGDFIDFLAEEKATRVGTTTAYTIDPGAAPAWTAFRPGPGEALAAFRAVVERDQPLFTALRALVASGKRLTLLLGNHDLELSIPDVRADLEKELGPGDVHFLDDGQALDLGDALIDHGNLFDPANAVDHDQLRVVRALYSRGWFEDLDRLFKPPAGSRLVADVMNPIKLAYGFIDLLKPESEPLLALLLAIEPSYRSLLDETAGAIAAAARTLVPRPGVPYALRNIADEYTADPSTIALRDVAAGTPAPPSALDTLLATTLAVDPAAALALQLTGLGPAAITTDVAAGTWRARWSLLRLLLRTDPEPDPELRLDARIPQVQATLRVLRDDHSHDRAHESPRYRDGARLLGTRGPTQKGFRAVVFGHTHHAKDLVIPGTSIRYLNTGTWANRMRFPDTLTDPKLSPADVKAALRTFAHHLQDNHLEPYLHFEPTYARLDLGPGGALLAAVVRTYDHLADRL